MGDRETIEKIFAIMRRLLLVRMDGLNPIPRKGTTRRECYRALYEIQELLETRRLIGKHLPQTNADKIRAMTDEELDRFLSGVHNNIGSGRAQIAVWNNNDRPIRIWRTGWLDWLKQEADHG